MKKILGWRNSGLTRAPRRMLGAVFASDPVFGRLARNSGWLFGANGWTLALGVVQSVVLARALGVRDFGVFALITTLTTAVNQLVDSRVWEAAIKFVVEFQERGQAAKAMATVKLCYLVDACAAVVVFFAIWRVAPWLADVFVHEPTAAAPLRIYATLVLIMVPFGTSSALLRIADRFDLVAYERAATATVRLAAVVLVALVRPGVGTFLIAFLVAAGAGAILVTVLAWRRAELGLASWGSAPLGALSGEFRRIGSFIAYSNLGGTSRLLTSKADILVLGWLTQPGAVGLYKLARSIVDPISLLFSSVYTAVYPEISRLVGQGKRRVLVSLERRLTKTLAGMGIVICASVTFAAPWLVPLLFGGEFEPAVPLVQIIVWQLVWTPLLWVPALLLSLGRARTVAGLNWIDALLYLGLLLWLVPAWEATGAAVSTLLRFVAWTTMACVLIIRVHRQRWDEARQVRTGDPGRDRAILR